MYVYYCVFVLLICVEFLFPRYDVNTKDGSFKSNVESMLSGALWSIKGLLLDKD